MTPLDLHDAGFRVVPIPPLQKRPLEKGWGTRAYTREHLAALFAADYNAGLLLGRDANLIDIEGDGPDAEQQIRELFGSDPPITLIAHSRRGIHRFFQWDDRLASLPGVVKQGDLEFRLGHTGSFQSLIYGRVEHEGEEIHRTFEYHPVANLPDAVIDKVLATKAPSPSKVYEAVATLNPARVDNYQDWFQVACALKACGDYFDLFDSWSRKSVKYGRTRETWDAIKPGAIGPGTLFHLAKLDGGGDTFKVISSAQLAIGNYELEYIIPDVLVANQPMLIGGASKSLKTSIIIDLALSLASGTNFLGVFPVNRTCKILVMSGESGIETLQETSHRIAWSKCIDLFDQANLFWSEELPACDDARSLAQLATTIARYGVEFVVVDPAYLSLGGDDHTNVIAQGKLLRTINKTCRDVGATLLLIHHSVKSAAKTGRPLHLEDLSMAGFSEFARQWILLNRREPFEPNASHKLWLVIGGSAGHASLSHLDVEEGIRSDEGGRDWKVTVTDYAAVLTGNRIASQQEKIDLIVQFLERHPRSTITQIVTATRIDNRQLRKLLKLAPVKEVPIPHPKSKSKVLVGYCVSERPKK